ncbi:hypothetical protein HPB51_009299 [Rhipicephalus microplus]|uniref:Uncharacterized protein n=1 Tax=Rhipicephalus microplus TaxID=6941 RepID=A0A9J6F054_RHIMP|nr:hypothetical protein HPB51_009299 [Rhipicephalus microplus]
MSASLEDYIAALCQKDLERYEFRRDENLLRVDPFTLRVGDCVSDVDLWPRVDSSDIHEFLVPRTSLKTREQTKSRKALEGHHVLKSGWLWEPWVIKIRRRHRDRRQDIISSASASHWKRAVGTLLSIC